MIIVTEHRVLSGSIDRVFECCWDAARWPEITPHVKRIDMHLQTPHHQEFSMTIESGGVQHTVDSARDAIGKRRISYRQTRPPAFLREHTGEWLFETAVEGVRVTLIHRAELDLPKALALLGASSVAEATEKVARTLKENGSRTLSAMSAFLHTNAPAVHP